MNIEVKEICILLRQNIGTKKVFCGRQLSVSVIIDIFTVSTPLPSPLSLTLFLWDLDGSHYCTLVHFILNIMRLQY